MRSCTVCKHTFEIDAQDLAFYEKVSPTFAGKLCLLPPPTLCPQCRHQRRLAFRNERYIYKTTCALTGKSIVSAYSPDKDLKVCDRIEWLEVDNTDFGRDFDFSRPFFEQFEELLRSTYKASLQQSGELVNSEYTQFTGWLKNCYLIFDSGKDEDCAYGIFGYCKNCSDCLYAYRSELCYESLMIEDCYHVLCSSYSKSCNFSAFLHDCIGCSKCLACTNLRNKRYHVLNEPVSEEDFERLWAQVFSGNYSELRKMQKSFEKLFKNSPKRAVRLVNSTDSRGDEIVRCENVRDCFNVREVKDCRYCYVLVFDCNDCYDVSSFGEQTQFCYELSGCGGALGKTGVSRCLFSSYIYYGGFNILYTSACHENSKDLFGCCDLRAKQYCILNKQYSKQEYEKLAARIVKHMKETGEWGEFFPMNISLFGYNESLAFEEFPLSREEGFSLGAKWSNYEPQQPKTEHIISPSDLPNDIAAMSDDILNSAVCCESTGRLFRIIKSELEFCRTYGVPLPRVHPDERHRKRWALKNPWRLLDIDCASCGCNTPTGYPPERQNAIYCEKCYEDHVYR